MKYEVTQALLSLTSEDAITLFVQWQYKGATITDNCNWLPVAATMQS